MDVDNLAVHDLAVTVRDGEVMVWWCGQSLIRFKKRIPATSSLCALLASGTIQERLIRDARWLADFAREACVRAGLIAGNAVIEIGCGPLGALLVLSELVGATGTVVGLDASASALAQAQQVLAHRQVTNVRLVQVDINTATITDINANSRFDLAFCCRVLMHQPDPTATLARIAQLLRPGGRVVIQVVLPDPSYPRFDPPIPAVARVIELLRMLMVHKGAAADFPRRHRSYCLNAGLRPISQRGFFGVPTDPQEPLSAVRAILKATRQGLIDNRLTTKPIA